MSNTNTLGKPPARLLCIDDNCDVLQLEKEILEEAGYEVLLASTAADGLNIVRGSMVDIVILDREMPQMTGTEVAHRIRAMRPMLPIIMVSGADQPKEMTGIVDCFVPKTQVASTLVPEVTRFLRRWPSSLLFESEFD
jgi:DNA-binding response OmpR family regulator